MQIPTRANRARVPAPSGVVTGVARPETAGLALASCLHIAASAVAVRVTIISTPVADGGGRGGRWWGGIAAPPGVMCAVARSQAQGFGGALCGGADAAIAVCVALVSATVAPGGGGGGV